MLISGRGGGRRDDNFDHGFFRLSIAKVMMKIKKIKKNFKNSITVWAANKNHLIST